MYATPRRHRQQFTTRQSADIATTTRLVTMSATIPTATDLWRVPSALRNSVDDGMLGIREPRTIYGCQATITAICGIQVLVSL